MGKVILSGMRFRSRIGVYAFEQEHGNLMEVEVEVDSPAIQGYTDQLSDTLDYAVIHHLVKMVMQQPHALLEHACRDILQLLVQHGVAGQAARVRVTKLQPPFETPVDKVSIELRWEKNTTSD